MWFCWYLFWNMWWPWHLESNCGRTWNPEMWCVEQPWEETCEILRNTLRYLDTTFSRAFVRDLESFHWETLRNVVKSCERPWETLCEILSETLRKRERPWETLRDPVRDHERPWETMRDLERPWETLRDLSDLEGTWIEFFFVFSCSTVRTQSGSLWFPFYHRNTTRNHATATALCPFIYPWGLQSYLRCRTQGFENLLHKAYIW